MPIIKSAKKQMRQSLKKRARNYRVRDNLKVTIKELKATVKKGSKADSDKALQAAYKVIDTAAKKNIIHKNNASRKKSSLARMVANIGNTKASSAEKLKKATKATVKETVAKDTEETANATEETQKK